MAINDKLVLIGGESSTGKSASLVNLADPQGVMYLNCECAKKLPFKSNFDEYTIVDPLQVYEAFTEAENMPHIHTIVVDSLTFLMDMYESVYVIPSTNTMAAWGDFQQFFKNLMQIHVANSTKNVIFTAHTLAQYSEANLAMEVKVPVKGSLKNNGIEAYFSTVVASRKVPIVKLKDYKNSLLNITPTEDHLGFKYVFQTKLTKDTVSERIRSPMGMWDDAETFIDNDCQKLLQRLDEYYA